MDKSGSGSIAPAAKTVLWPHSAHTAACSMTEHRVLLLHEIVEDVVCQKWATELPLLEE